MPSIYLSRDPGIEGPDPAMLELKIHYLMAQLAAAGLLKDSDGKAVKISNEVQEDADTVQQALVGDNYWRDDQ